MKRVAVCISGQSRTWRYCIDGIRKFFEESNEYQIDYFIHTWDYNTYPNLFEGRCAWDLQFDKQIPNRQSHQFNDNVDDYIKSYNPLKYKIDTQQHFDDKLLRLSKKINSDINNIKDVKNITNYNLLSSMFSFKQSILLKKLHETQNHFKYDYVVKIRPDLVFLHKKFKEHISTLESSEKNSFISYFNFDPTDKKDFWAPDLYWLFSSSSLIDDYSSFFYDKLKHDLKHNDNKYGFNRHICEKNLTPISIGTTFNTNYVIILRPFLIPFINLNDTDENIDTIYINTGHYFTSHEKNDPLIAQLLEKYGLLNEFVNTNVVAFFNKYPKLIKIISNSSPSYL